MHKSTSRILDLVPKLEYIFSGGNLYEQLLECKGENAQLLLDSFQSLLDTPDLDQNFWSRLFSATRELSKKAGVLPGCYELRNIKVNAIPVASGAFSDVYQAEFEGHVVCLKALRMTQATEKEMLLKDISKEGVLWAQMDHDNVLRMLGVFLYNSRICFVSPWMGGGNLTDYLRSNPYAPRRLLIMDVAKGLKYLHDIGIIHGDLKGLNVLVNELGVACLSDFGLSSLPSMIAAQSASSFSGFGTVSYTAPELFIFDDDAPRLKPSKASDVYSWACVCYEVFVGDRPLGEIPHMMVPFRVKNGSRPKRPHDTHPSWSKWKLNAEIWCIMEDCWKEIPSHRPQIDMVIVRLNPMVGDDDRHYESPRSVYTPNAIRRQMCKKVDIRAIVLALDNLTSSTEARKSNHDEVPVQPQANPCENKNTTDKVEEDDLIRNEGTGIPIGPDGKPKPLLPSILPEHVGRKCLVLDPDETLIHTSSKPFPQADFIVSIESESRKHPYYVQKRPGVDYFLKRIGELYEVVVFSGSLSGYIDAILDKLDLHCNITHRLYRKSCYFHQGKYVKDLSQLGRPLADCIVVDNTPDSYLFHPRNVVPVSSWYNDVYDKELTDLIPFLEDLAGVEDVRSVLTSLGL